MHWQVYLYCIFTYPTPLLWKTIEKLHKITNVQPKKFNMNWTFKIKNYIWLSKCETVFWQESKFVKVEDVLKFEIFLITCDNRLNRLCTSFDFRLL